MSGGGTGYRRWRWRRGEERSVCGADVHANQQGGVIDAQEATHGHEQRLPRRTEDLRRLRPLEASVERHEHRTGPEGAERGQHPFGTVRRPHGHPVARGDAGGDETAGVSVDLGSQLGEASAAPSPSTSASSEAWRTAASSTRRGTVPQSKSALGSSCSAGMPPMPWGGPTVEATGSRLRRCAVMGVGCSPRRPHHSCRTRGESQAARPPPTPGPRPRVEEEQLAVASGSPGSRTMRDQARGHA